MAHCIKGLTDNPKVAGSNPWVLTEFYVAVAPMHWLVYKNGPGGEMDCGFAQLKNTWDYSKIIRDWFTVPGFFLSLSNHHHFIAVNWPCLLIKWRWKTKQWSIENWEIVECDIFNFGIKYIDLLGVTPKCPQTAQIHWHIYTPSFL